MQSRAASRYAKSLIELSLEKGELEKVYADMKLIQSVCKDSRDFMNLLQSPVVKADAKEKILKVLLIMKRGRNVNFISMFVANLILPRFKVIGVYSKM